MHEKILILDFGSQVTQMIARRVRDAGVFSEVYPADVDEAFLREQIQHKGVKGIIISGGAADSDIEAPTMELSPFVFLAGVPVLGIGYGMHMMAKLLGGEVDITGDKEFGQVHVAVKGNSSLFATLSDGKSAEGHNQLDVWMNHGTQVTELPAGFMRIGFSKVRMNNWPPKR